MWPHPSWSRFGAGERRDHRSYRQQIGANEEQWKRYLYDSKPMLPLDFVLTDWLTGGWPRSERYASLLRDPGSSF
jgi:hypothetical protein